MHKPSRVFSLCLRVLPGLERSELDKLSMFSTKRVRFLIIIRILIDVLRENSHSASKTITIINSFKFAIKIYEIYKIFSLSRGQGFVTSQAFLSLLQFYYTSYILLHKNYDLHTRNKHQESYSRIYILSTINSDKNCSLKQLFWNCGKTGRETIVSNSENMSHEIKYKARAVSHG